MRNLMGIIDASGKAESLGGLTSHRPAAAVPFAANYRLIDFILSSMVNSGIFNIAVLVPGNKYSSLVDHLGSGKEWDLDRKNDGLFIFPSDISCREYLKRSRQEYVVISRSNLVCNINFFQAFNFHQEIGADITLLYKEIPFAKNQEKCMVVDVTSEGRIKTMTNNNFPKEKEKIFLGVAILRKSLLLEIVGDDSAEKLAGYQEAIARNLQELRVYGYPYKGYLAVINTVQDYYQQSLALLNTDMSRELFFKSDAIYTKVKDEPPVKYNHNSIVKAALVANGCKIFGEIHNSILSREVLVSKGAKVVNSIIMAKSIIEEGAVIKNCIIDKRVRITGKKVLKGEPDKPLLIKKGVII